MPAIALIFMFSCCKCFSRAARSLMRLLLPVRTPVDSRHQRPLDESCVAGRSGPAERRPH